MSQEPETEIEILRAIRKEIKTVNEWLTVFALTAGVLGVIVGIPFLIALWQFISK